MLGCHAGYFHLPWARLMLLVPALVFAAIASAAPAVIAVLTALFGLSNGYLTAAAMTLAPSFATPYQPLRPPDTPSEPSSHGPAPPPPWGANLGFDWLGSGFGQREAAVQGGPAASSQYVSLGSLGRSESGGGMLGSPQRAQGSVGAVSGAAAVHVSRGASPRHQEGHAAGRLKGGWGSGGGADAGPSQLSRGVLARAANTGTRQVGVHEQTDADMAEDLCVISLVSGLTVGAMTAWLWLLLPHAS